MSDGWAVEVVIQVLGGGHSTQVYNARVSNKTKAEELVKKHIGATPDVRITAVKPISASDFEAMKINPGQVGQWI